MTRCELNRKGVVAATYFEETQRLIVEFYGGRAYEYQGVPQGVFGWLVRTPDPGGYVSRVITANYEYRALAPQTPTSSLDADLEAQLRASLEQLGEKSST